MFLFVNILSKLCICSVSHKREKQQSIYIYMLCCYIYLCIWFKHGQVRGSFVGCPSTRLMARHGNEAFNDISLLQFFFSFAGQLDPLLLKGFRRRDNWEAGRKNSLKELLSAETAQTKHNILQNPPALCVITFPINDKSSPDLPKCP